MIKIHRAVLISIVHVLTKLFPTFSIVTLTSKINRVHPLITGNICAKFDTNTHVGSLYVHKVVYSDLDPLSIKINRGDHLIMVSISFKFDDDVPNGSISITFTRSRFDAQTCWATVAKANLHQHRVNNNK